eukprot:CAMPEP_0178954788 /NCGR_PEP_ID=MMETSP0789-20121207/9205_1 /TAXON_ID=3005 /ORGANISM="Rhizosolenia setigera, Strain CCMP 1694" /LENGTH=234 /DNA_ID=CAMNT_0020636269 /DNA_START=378 /DNA_END=1082 /DNA_ORIENTATION=+
MVKISQLVIGLLAVGSASAFSPSPAVSTRAFVRSSPLRLSEEVEEAAPAPPAPPAAPATSSAIVPVKEETVEFTAGILGGVVGFAIGGPVLGAIGAAASNYASKSDNEIGEVLSAVSKTSIEVFNYLANLDAKYELLNKSKKSLEEALDKVKANGNVEPDTVKKMEDALSQTTSKIKEINEEYDLVGAGLTAFGVIGDLVEKAVIKAGELNEEYKLTDKAKESLSSAVSKAKSS